MHIERIQYPSGKTYLALHGTFDALGAKTAKPVFEYVASNRDADVILDLGGVDFIDSSGVGAMVFLYKRLTAADRGLELVGVTGQPRDLLSMLRIDKVLPVNRTAAPSEEGGESVGTAV